MFYRVKDPEKEGGWNETLRTFFWAVVIALVFRSFFFEPFHIPSGSMKSNLLVGDYLFVTKYSYGYSRYSFPFGLPPFHGRVMELAKPKRGDVVVFRLPTNTRIDYIKRIIGLPGDRIQVKNSIVYINDKPLPREQADIYTEDEDSGHMRSIPRFHETLPEGKVITILQERQTGFANNTPEYTVPEGHYFMMGDNRDNSRDSRFSDEVGFVPEENILGRADLIFFSFGGWNEKPPLRLERFFKHID
ncbi:MAG: signal peptidase I [Alphaproteobacteria bacterium]|nr:signal peptidase I [Alphaproteobacteria bacterium]